MNGPEYTTFEVQPPRVQMSESRLRRTYVVSWGDERFVNENGREVYKTYSVEMKGELRYDALISAIISKRYAEADVTAIFLNYINRDNVSAEKATEYVAEYDALQAWRAEAKRIAAEAMAYAREKGWIE